MVSVIILAGGYATRLRPLSLTKPKTLLPILGRPLLDYILDEVERLEPKGVFLSLRVMANKIVSHVTMGRRNVVTVIEKERLGDAGPLKLIFENYKLNDVTLVLNGDVYFETDLREVVKFHESEGCDATVVGKEVEDPRRFGVLVTDGIYLKDIFEKPKIPPGNLVNTGIYVFNSALLKEVNGQSIARNFLPYLLKTNRRICVYRYNGIWADIGKPEDYLELNFRLLVEKHPKGFVSENSRVSERASLTPPYFIGERTEVREDSEVFNSVIGIGCYLGEGSRVQDSLLMNGVKVEKYSLINFSILGDNVTVGKRARLESSILGDEVEVYDNVLLNEGTIVLPNKEISESVYDRHKIIL
jgi:mannose-1-phosphate guanylyltransferase